LLRRVGGNGAFDQHQLVLTYLLAVVQQHLASGVEKPIKSTG
jgi:hypothetical protein